MMTLRVFLLLTIAAALTAVSGCGRKYHMTEEQPQIAAQEGVTEFSGVLDVVWETDFKGKPSGPLTLDNNVLAVPSARRRIVFFDWATGKSLGHIKQKGLVQGSLARADALGLFALGPPRNRLMAYDLLRHREIWRQPLTDAAPRITIVEDRAVAAAANGELVAFSMDSGEPLWTFRDSGRFVASPVVHDGVVYQSDDDGILYAVSLDTGEGIFRADLGDPIVSAVSISGVIVATTVTGRLFALAPEDGRILWETDLAAENWTAAAISSQTVVTVLSRGIVVALDIVNGSELWRFDIEQAVRASPVIVDHTVLVATLRGTLCSLNLSDGSEIARREFSDAIPYAPLSDGRRVVVATRSGDLICVGETTDNR